MHDGKAAIPDLLAAIEKHLMRDGLVMRHDPRELEPHESEPTEGAFLACTLWLADAHVMAGNVDKARLKKSIDILVEANNLPRTPTVAEIFTPAFLPPVDDLPKKLF